MSPPRRIHEGALLSVSMRVVVTCTVRRATIMHLLFDYNDNATIVQQFLLDKYKHTKGEREREEEKQNRFFMEGG